jgi:hypothetical protein
MTSIRERRVLERLGEGEVGCNVSGLGLDQNWMISFEVARLPAYLEETSTQLD